MMARSLAGWTIFRLKGWSSIGVPVSRPSKKACCAWGSRGWLALQIIFNLFRQDAAEKLLPMAAEKDVGIIVRLSLANGLLSGKV